MKKIAICGLVVLTGTFQLLFAQQQSVSIGSANVDTDAVLMLVGNGSQGLIIPTTGNISGMPPKAGMVVYNSTDKKVYYSDGTTWAAFGGATAAATPVLTIDGNNISIFSNAAIKLAGSAPTQPGQLFMWDGQKWTATTGTAPQPNDYLKWNGTSWAPAAFTSANGTVTEVTTTAPLTVATGTTTPAISIAAAGITNSLMAPNSVTSANIASASINASHLSSLGATNSGQVLQWNGSAWAPASLPSATTGNFSTPNTAIQITGGGSAVIGAGTTINIANATATQTGLLSAADFDLFSKKGDMLKTTYDTNTDGIVDAAASVNFTSQALNTVLAAPAANAGVPTFRLLTASDIPVLDAAKITTGTLPVARGGTGLATAPTNGQLLIGGTNGFALSTLTAGTGVTVTNASGTITIASTGMVNPMTSGGDIIYGSGANATPTRLATGTGFLKGGTTPSYSKVDISNTNDITGTLPIASGGTGAATAAAALTNLGALSNPMTAQGDIIYGGASGVPTKLVTGTGFLKGGATPSYSAVTLSGTDVTGTLPIGKGGTGVATTPTNGQLLIGNGTGFATAALTAGTNVSITNGAGSITINSTGMANPLTTNGDIIYAVGTTPTRLATGTGFLKGGAVPSYSSVNLATTDVTGTLLIANGGTNSTATPANGGIAYGNGTAYAFTATGTAGQVLQSNGAAAPTWVAGGWKLGGNLGTNSTNDYIGTGDATNLSISTNATARVTVLGTGEVGVSNATPTAALDVIGSGKTGIKVTTDDPNGYAISATNTSIGDVAGLFIANNPAGGINNHGVFAGASGAGSGIYAASLATATGSAAIFNNFNAGNTSAVVQIMNSGSGPALTTDIGNVGINTQNPQQKLHIVGQSNVGQIRLEDPSDFWELSAGTDLAFRNSAGVDRLIVWGDGHNEIKGDLLLSSGSLTIQDGTQAAGKVLTSDANGLATWQSVAGTGDMTKSVYDNDTDNIIDVAALPGGTLYNSSIPNSAGDVSGDYSSGLYIQNTPAAGTNIITTISNVGTTGTIPIARGGTGSTTAAGALTNLGALSNPMTAVADMIVGGAAGTPTVLAAPGGKALLGFDGTNQTWVTGSTPNQLLATNGAGNFTFVNQSNFMTTALASTNIFVGSVGGVATPVTVSGDIGITNAGAVTISNTATTGGNIVTAINTSSGSINGARVNPTFGAQNLSTTGTLTTGTGGQFTVDAAGNIKKINNVATSFPASQGGANTVLTNDGAGNLTWGAGSGWGFSGNSLAGTEFIGSTNSQPLRFSTNTGGGGGERMRIDATGNVGIGTTTPQDLLHVNGTTNGKIRVTNNTIGSTSTDGLTLQMDNTGVATINTGENANMVLGANGNNVIFLTPAGKVGINNNAPASVLDLTGDIRIGQAGAPGVTTDKLYNVSGSLFWNGTNISSGGSGWGFSGNSLAGGEVIGSTNTFPLSFITSNNPRMTIEATGNVGIGTPTPTQNLTVQGGMNVDGADANDGTSAKNTLHFGATSGETIGSRRTPGVNQFGLDFYTNDVARMSITQAGNIGIGSSNPTSILDLTEGDGTNGYPVLSINANNSSAGTTPSIEFSTSIYNGSSNRSDAEWQMGVRTNASGTSDPLDRWYVGRSGVSSQDLVVSREGNVGVGTPAPSAKLFVSSFGENDGLGNNIAVFGNATSSANGENVYGVYANANGGLNNPNFAIGLYATGAGATNNYAAIFENGKVQINNELEVGNGIGTAGQVLTSSGGGAMTWQNAGSGGGFTSTASTVVRVNGGATAQEASTIYDVPGFTSVGGTTQHYGVQNRFTVEAGSGSGAYGGMYVRTTGSTKPFYGFLNAGNEIGWITIDPNDNNKMLFYNNSSLSLTLDDGKVGMGTSTPSQKLEINDAASVGSDLASVLVYSNNLTASGAIRATGNDNGTPTATSDTYSIGSLAAFVASPAGGYVDAGTLGHANDVGPSAGGLFTNGGNDPATAPRWAMIASDVYAGEFEGDVQINGNLNVTGAKSFKIDHPLDPANKYLYHAAIESPDMMNMYNGNIVTNANGDATIELPSYFEALNKDFRYQLTVIGTFAQAIVASKIENNRFSIKTDKPNVEVSWQVTGIRKDPYAEQHRMKPEVMKVGDERGKYLSPEEQGRQKSDRVGSGSGNTRVKRKRN